MTVTFAAQKGIQSIEIGGRLLSALVDAARPMPLGALAKEAGMSASKARRYLISFARVGLVEQDAATLCYGLGWFSLRLGLAATANRDMVRQSKYALQQLAAEINETVALVVWMGRGPTVVHFEERVRGLLRVVAQLGATLPIVNTAAGRIFAAYMPPQFTAPLVGRELKGEAQTPYAPRTPVSRKEFERIVSEVRERQLARTAGEASQPVATMAAPIFGTDGELLGAVVALGYQGTFDVRWNGKVAAGLRKTALGIAKSMGSTGADPARPQKRKA